MASVGHKRERSFLPIQPFNLGRHPRQILLFRLLSDALQYVCTTSELVVSFQVSGTSTAAAYGPSGHKETLKKLVGTSLP